MGFPTSGPHEFVWLGPWAVGQTEAQPWHQYLNKCSKHREGPPTPYSLQDSNLDDSRFKKKQARFESLQEKVRNYFEDGFGTFGRIFCFMYTYK